MTAFRRTKGEEDLDVLIAESQRIRDELLKTSTKLEVFTAQLAEEAARLKAEAEAMEGNNGE